MMHVFLCKKNRNASIGFGPLPQNNATVEQILRDYYASDIFVFDLLTKSEDRTIQANILKDQSGNIWLIDFERSFISIRKPPERP
ncbi:MAG: hypothetical protein R3A45_01440 [Bdellovibrionota bacterium]